MRSCFWQEGGGVPAHPLSKRTSLETHRPAIWDWPHTHLAPCHNLFSDPKLKWSHLEIVTPPRTFELNSGRFFKASLHWHPQSVSSRLQEATQSVHWALNDIIWSCDEADCYIQDCSCVEQLRLCSSAKNLLRVLPGCCGHIRSERVHQLM